MAHPLKIKEQIIIQSVKDLRDINQSTRLYPHTYEVIIVKNFLN